jgi:hypothetical protein
MNCGVDYAFIFVNEMEVKGKQWASNSRWCASAQRFATFRSRNWPLLEFGRYVRPFVPLSSICILVGIALFVLALWRTARLPILLLRYLVADIRVA